MKFEKSTSLEQSVIVDNLLCIVLSATVEISFLFWLIPCNSLLNPTMTICSSFDSSSSSSLSTRSWILHGIVAGAAIAAAFGARFYLTTSRKFRGRVVGIIPARFASSRFEGKPLVQILGKPMIQIRPLSSYLSLCSIDQSF